METKMYKNVSLLANPNKKEHLVNKAYVDNMINRKVKDAVVALCADDLDATYDSILKTLTQKTPSTLIIDDILVKVGDRILVTGQLDRTQNGIYVVTTISGSSTPSTATVGLGVGNTGIVTSSSVSFDKDAFETKLGTPTTGTYTFTYSAADTSWKFGAAAITLGDYGLSVSTETPQDNDEIIVNYTEATPTSPAVLTRSDDFFSQEDMVLNVMIPVQSGTQNADTIWVMTNDTLPTIDVDVISFANRTSEVDGVTVFSTTFTGNGVDKEFTINHGLSTENVTVTIKDAATKELCYFGVTVTTENVVTISSDVVLGPTDSFEVTILG